MLECIDLCVSHTPNPSQEGKNKKLSVLCGEKNSSLKTHNYEKRNHPKNSAPRHHDSDGGCDHFRHHLVHKSDAIGGFVAKICHSPHLPLSIYNKVYKRSERQGADALRPTKNRPTEACEHDFEHFFKKNLGMFWRFKKKLYLCTRNRETNLGYEKQCGNSSVGRA